MDLGKLVSKLIVGSSVILAANTVDVISQEYLVKEQVVKNGKVEYVDYKMIQEEGGVWKINIATGEKIFIANNGEVLGDKKGLTEKFGDQNLIRHDGTNEYSKEVWSSKSKDDSAGGNDVPPASVRVQSPTPSVVSIEDAVTPTSTHVRVSGFSDGKYSGVQKDREEAILDAQRLALEQAGIHISSETTIENFQLKRDLIKSKARGMLKGDYVEKGYNQDKVFEVVFVGDVVQSKEFLLSEKYFKEGKKCYDNYNYICSKGLLEKSIELDSSNAGSYFYLGQSLRNLGPNFFDNALKNYYVAVDKDFRKGDAYALIACIFACKYYYAQSKEKVYEAYEKGAKLGNSYCIEGLKNFEKICKDNGMN